MDNVFNNAMSDAAKKDPPFSHIVVPQMRKAPWIAPLQSHEGDDKFGNDIVSRKNGAQKVSLEAWILYIVRFISTVGICSARENFGGLPAQCCMISVALHLAVVEAAAFAIAYDSELRGRIQRLARRRDTQFDIATMLSEENGEVKRY